MAWMVEIRGTSKSSASVTDGSATSQSWACTTSGTQPCRCSCSPARIMLCPMARAQAIMSVPKSYSCGSWAAAMIRTPSLTLSAVGCEAGSVPAGWRDSTTTSWPSAASAVASW